MGMAGARASHQNRAYFSYLNTKRVHICRQQLRARAFCVRTYIRLVGDCTQSGACMDATRGQVQRNQLPLIFSLNPEPL